jgi:hypothetical protein
MNRQSSDETRKLQLIREILDDLLSFWESASGVEVDAELLRQFAWAVDEAYEELAHLLVTHSPAQGDEAEPEEDV